ncbi:MAG: Fe2+-dependent dioxygenase [Pseudomonadales bacterium]|nr:Fe2+-dependent dioxygenase [Pseudomonadales bacterium]
MLTVIEDFLDPAELKSILTVLKSSIWHDGQQTAGALAARVKFNQQLAMDCKTAQDSGEYIRRKLSQHPQFVAAALPRHILLPRFNRYTNGGSYGAHVDNSLMYDGDVAVRTDLSCTLFLSEPESYEGGELCIENGFGIQQIKLRSGDLVLYPANSVHEVRPVQTGERLAAFFWVQSLVADHEARSMLYDLDCAIQSYPENGEAKIPDPRLQLTGLYHNLLRRWWQA